MENNLQQPIWIPFTREFYLAKEICHVFYQPISFAPGHENSAQTKGMKT